MWQILAVKYKFPEFYLEKITAASYTADTLLFLLRPPMNEPWAYKMYLGLSMCCLLILKIPHIPGKFSAAKSSFAFYSATRLDVCPLHDRS